VKKIIFDNGVRQIDEAIHLMNEIIEFKMKESFSE
jgi:hypothetical protein